MTIAFCFCLFLYSNKFEVNFYEVVLIIIRKHLEIYTKQLVASVITIMLTIPFVSMQHFFLVQVM